MKKPYLIITSALLLTSSYAIGMITKGSGLPIYDLASDLTCNSSHTSCTSKNWLDNTINKQAPTAKIKYLYLDYPYINYFVNVDPTDKKNQMKDMVNSTCSDISPTFISYNVYTQRQSNIPQQCIANGSAANQTYNPDDKYKVMPTFSFDNSLVTAANSCYTESGGIYTFNAANCHIPCTTKGNNPLFTNPTDQCINNQMNVTNETNLFKLVSQTGELVGMLIAQDKTAAGASFDIEGPPFIPVLANQFYNGVVSQIKGKDIGIWRGVNIFGRNEQDYKTLSMIAQHNGFIILSMYDIGPDDSTTNIVSGGNTLSYVHGGGLEVAQPAYWYAGAPVPANMGSFLQPSAGGKSNYSAFEIMLFGVPTYYQNATLLDCHPKELMMNKSSTEKYTWQTGFNGCTGSQSFIQRFMNNAKLDIPFQVGIPAVASTTEWINAVAWGSTEALKKLAILNSKDGQTWIQSGACPATMDISGQSCMLFSFKSNFKATDNSQISYLDLDTGGALNILANHIQGKQAKGMIPEYSGDTLPALTKIQSYMKKNFMGLYIYALKPTNFDKDNCEYQLSHGKSICYANFPNSNLNNDISPNVWSAISKFAQNNQI